MSFYTLDFLSSVNSLSEWDSPVRTLWLSVTATVGGVDFPYESLAGTFNSWVIRKKLWISTCGKIHTRYAILENHWAGVSIDTLFGLRRKRH